MNEEGRENNYSQGRYLVDELVINPEVKVLNFKPTENGRDIHGNRIFSSPFAYLDPDDRLSRAAVLVTSEGEEFIRRRPGILKIIDRGLKTVTDLIETNMIDLLNDNQPALEIAPDTTIAWIATGGQSNTFVLGINQEKYIVKTLVSNHANFTDYSQPYINEVLQTQELADAIAAETSQVHLTFSDFLFATGHVICTRFVVRSKASKHPTADDRDKLIDVLDKASEFAKSRNESGDPLWQGIGVDYLKGIVPAINIIKTENGFVWVDPVFHEDELRVNWGQTTSVL